MANTIEIEIPRIDLQSLAEKRNKGLVAAIVSKSRI